MQALGSMRSSCISIRGIPETASCWTAGHYGVGGGGHRPTASDVVDPSQIEISIEAYVEFFAAEGKNEELHAFVLTMPKEAEEAIRAKIGQQDGRSVGGQCALAATELLTSTGLFPGLKKTGKPHVLKGFFEKFASSPPDGVSVVSSTFSLELEKKAEDDDETP